MSTERSGPIYIVENDEAVRQSLRLLLEVEGHQVEDFANAEEFLKNRDGREAACLVLDYQLDNMTGLALLEKLRSDGVNTPAIIVTAQDLTHEARNGQAGALVILQKPTTATELLGWINQALSATRAPRA